MNEQGGLHQQETAGVPRRRLLAIVAVLVPVGGLVALMAWALVESGGHPAGIAINNLFGEVSVKERPALDFRLDLFEGGTISLSQLKGKVVLIDFWSSWCPPCQREAPTLAEVYRRHRGNDVEFVGVAIWDSEKEALRFVERYGLEYPNGLDSAGKIAIDYGLTGIPEKYLIDRQGRVVRKFVGPMDLVRLEALLSEFSLP